MAAGQAGAAAMLIPAKNFSESGSRCQELSKISCESLRREKKLQVGQQSYVRAWP